MKTIVTLAALFFVMGASIAESQRVGAQVSDSQKPVSGISRPLHAVGNSAPWAVKSNFSGFTREEDVRTEICELYDHKVVLKRRYGKQLTEQVIHLDTLGSFSLLSKQAFAEDIVKGGPAPCDAPSTVVIVNRWIPGSGSEPFTIYASGGCGNTPRRRNGPASRTFMDILGQYCPNTVPIFSGD